VVLSPQSWFSLPSGERVRVRGRKKCKNQKENIKSQFKIKN
jgi:hypothetical protein